MAAPGAGAARHRQAHYPSGKALLGAAAGRAQGVEPDVRKRRRQTDAQVTSGSDAGRFRGSRRCGLLAEGVQLARSVALRCAAPYRQGQKFQPLPDRREGGGDRRGPPGFESGDAAG